LKHLADLCVGRPPSGDSVRRIDALLDIAAEVFIRKGYESTSVAENAPQAHASKETLYSRFSTKAELFTAVLKRRSEEGFTRVTNLVESADPIEQVLTAYAAELFLPFIHQELLRLLRTIISAAENFPEVGQAFWIIGPERAHQMLTDLLRDRMVNGELRTDDPAQAAHLFLAMCSGRYWYRTLVDVRPRITKAEVEAYTTRVVESFLLIYSPGSHH
jgi:TetR/AcrR family transcriptional regulator, mexJK operon transcriptional repressor